MEMEEERHGEQKRVALQEEELGNGCFASSSNVTGSSSNVDATTQNSCSTEAAGSKLPFPRNVSTDQIKNIIGQGKEKVKSFIIRDQLQRDQEKALYYVIRGMSKGFLIYTVPLAIIQRKLTGLTIKRGAAVSIFVGLVRSFHRFHRWLKTLNVEENDQGHQRHYLAREALLLFQSKLPWMGIAGAVAAWIGLKLDPYLLSSTLAFWVLVRAVRCLPLPQWKYGPTLIMCLSSAQILSTWIAAPDDLPKSYRRFLDRQGGINTSMKKRLLAGEQFCTVCHPETSHSGYIAKQLYQQFWKSLKLYLPLNLLFFLMASRKNITGLQRLAFNVIRSTAFLTIYCTSALLTGCVLYRMHPWRMTRTSMFCHAWVPGLATLIEPFGRQAELAAYCLTFALETIYRLLRGKGYLSSAPWRSQAIIVISMGVIMQHIRQQPKILNWLFGIV